MNHFCFFIPVVPRLNTRGDTPEKPLPAYGQECERGIKRTGGHQDITKKMLHCDMVRVNILDVDLTLRR